MLRWLLIFGFLVGCADASTPMDMPPPTPPPTGDAPTWYGEVAHIVYDNCIGCHFEGGAAPFSLLGYDEAKLQALRIERAVVDRTMPPWGANNDGDCQTFEDARWLTDEEIDTVVRWVAAEAPEGDPADGPSLPALAPGLGTVTHVADMGVTYTPDATREDDYRCFPIDLGNDTDMFLTEFEVKPGDPTIVHHIIIYSADTASAESRLAELVAEDETPGYECFGGARLPDSRFIAGWAPGTAVRKYPEGTGVRVTGGRQMVMQVHYNLAAGPRPDRSVINMHLEETATEGLVFPVADFTMELPPRMEYVETSETFPAQNPIPVQIHGVFPHMHTLGRTLRVDRIAADGTEECMVDVQNYDFNWQQFYLYERPLTVQPSDSIRITCGYETTERNEPTYWGDGTRDEMCLNYLYVTL